jgi:hypothetical protein
MPVYALPDWFLGITQRILKVGGSQVEMTHFQTLSRLRYAAERRGAIFDLWIVK